ncbi:hypothetical protein BOO35_19600 [Vibrio navarrensis]|uniref:hypothetical protein n=1 Tax=Vibrio navarrensis TaxID=29495 RepID=UPI0018692CF7|nr:hypothetical protein [Vibrio navarrensis]MBE3667261.1 hypothetical protein [Vibrio navarrensis]
MFGEKFVLLQQEGFLTQSSLCQGLTNLRKANIGDQERGLFYSAFFQLSIGIERLMKLTVLLDYMLENKLRVMTDKQLKHQYGHKIKDLYSAVQTIAVRHEIPVDGFFDEGTEWNIVHFMHEFALTARYYNLSKLSGGANSQDPLSAWWNIIYDLYLDEVSEIKRNNIRVECYSICDARGSNSFTYFHDFQGNIMTELECLMYPKIIEASPPHAVWFIIKILQPIFSVLTELQGKVKQLENEIGEQKSVIPFLHEFFPFLYCSRSMALKRKKWS